MLVTGLDGIVLRSLLESKLVQGFPINNYVYLFSGTPPTAIEDLNIEFTRVPVTDEALLHNAADAVLNFSADVVQDTGVVKFNITNGLYSCYKEKHVCYKSNPDVSVYDRNLLQYRNLGDALVYYANNLANRQTTGSGFPTLAIPALESQDFRLANNIANGSFSGKDVRSVNSADSWRFLFGRRGNNKNASGQDLPTNSSRGHAIVVFDTEVEADFILFNLGWTGTVVRGTTLTYLSLILQDDTFVELPTFAASPNVLYCVPFNKQMIKGIRIANAHEPINTSTQTNTNFYGTVFTAGLSDYLGNALASVQRDPITWGIITPTLNTDTRAMVNYTQPMLIVTVGGVGSGSNIEIDGHDQMYLTNDCIVNKSLLEL